MRLPLPVISIIHFQAGRRNGNIRDKFLGLREVEGEEMADGDEAGIGMRGFAGGGGSGVPGGDGYEQAGDEGGSRGAGKCGDGYAITGFVGA